MKILLLLPLVLFAACAPEAPPADAPVPRPTLENRADSVALRIYEATGGPDVWTATRPSTSAPWLASRLPKQA